MDRAANCVCARVRAISNNCVGAKFRPAANTALARSIATAALLTALICGTTAAVAAEKAFGGDDAAYVDWAWKNCDMVSTDKQHDLVDKARTKNNDAFQRGYEAQYNKILAANPAPAEVKRTCEQVRDWYGPLGSKIATLVASKVASKQGAGVSVGSKSSSGSSGGGGGGGKRGGGGR